MNRVENVGQREKLFVLSNFSFCHNVFKRPLLHRHQKASVCGRGLTRDSDSEVHHGIYRSLVARPFNTVWEISTSPKPTDFEKCLSLRISPFIRQVNDVKQTNGLCFSCSGFHSCKLCRPKWVSISNSFFS